MYMYFRFVCIIFQPARVFDHQPARVFDRQPARVYDRHTARVFDPQSQCLALARVFDPQSQLFHHPILETSHRPLADDHRYFLGSSTISATTGFW